MKQLKTLEELEKELKVLYAKYYLTIERLKKAKESLLNLLSDLSSKQEDIVNRNDLISLLRSNTAYMNLLSLSRSYFDNIASLRRYIQAYRNSESK